MKMDVLRTGRMIIPMVVPLVGTSGDHMGNSDGRLPRRVLVLVVVRWTIRMAVDFIVKMSAAIRMFVVSVKDMAGILLSPNKIKRNKLSSTVFYNIYVYIFSQIRHLLI